MCNCASEFVLRTPRNDEVGPDDLRRDRKNIPRRGGAGAGHPDPPRRRFRSRARCLAGRFRGGAGTLDGFRHAGQSARVAGQCRPQQGDRPCQTQHSVSRQATGIDAPIAARRLGVLRGHRYHARRRHASADLYLLPSVLWRRGPGRADAAHGLRAQHRAGRPRLSGERGGDGAAVVARQAENPPCRHSL